MITVWLIQPQSVWTRLQEEKRLFVDPDSHDDIEYWPDTYDWLREQMRKRVANYQGHYPWHSYYIPKPDLRLYRHCLPYTPEPDVRLEVQLPEDRVLVYHPSAFSYVIMQVAVSKTLAEGEYWDNLRDQYGKYNLPANLQSELEATWERIFDRQLPEYDTAPVEKSEHRLWNPMLWDAAFEELRLEDVRKVTVFQTVPSQGKP